MDKAKLAELRSQYGEIAVVETPLGVFAFRAAELDDWEHYKEQLNGFAAGKKGSASAAQREVAQKCLADPTQLEELQKAFKRYPGMVSPLVDKLGTLAGSDFEITIKKG